MRKERKKVERKRVMKGNGGRKEEMKCRIVIIKQI